MWAQPVLGSAGDPSWDVVAATDLKRRPYDAVGAVATVRNGREVARGTAWLIAPDAAVTAAHVVDHWACAGTTRVVFPGADEIARVITIAVPPGYRQGDGLPDPWDLAVLRLERNARPFLATGRPILAAVRLLGFPFADGRLTESRSVALRPDASFVLHRAEARNGHSGAPIFNAADGGVIGMHVAGFVANPYKSAYPLHNVGLLLRPELQQFIHESIAGWR